MRMLIILDEIKNHNALMLRIKVAFVFLGALSGLIASDSSGQCSSSTLYSKEFEAGNPIDGGESVALDLSGFAGTTVALNFDWVVPECFTGPGHLEFTNIAMNGTCLPSDFIFTSAFGDLSQPYWDGCVGNITMDGCPSDIAPAVGTMSVSVLVPLEQENILTFNLDWVSLNEGNEPRLFSISTGCNSESEEADCTDCAGSNTLFNPDYNGDGFIGVDDILGVLSFYDNAWDGPVSPSWSCGEAITYSGVGYSTVQIGDQCWFAENLSTTTYLNGDAIPQNLSNGGWSSTTSGAMAFYDNVPTNSGLYNFYAVNDSRGLCPSGWHVPTDGEWTIMIDHLGGVSVAGDQIKATYGWNGGNNGSNSSGFTGLPGGYRYDDGTFYDVGGNGSWWSSSPTGIGGWYRYLYNYLGNDVYRGSHAARLGFSVRCIQDAE